MGRPRKNGVPLPEHVQRVRKKNGREYFYYAPRRGAKDAPKAIPLGTDTLDPEFWRRYRKAAGTDGETEGTWAHLIAAFKASHEWERLRPRTRADYETYLDKLEISVGDRAVKSMTRADVYDFRDRMDDTPVAANHMLSVLQTIVEWGVPRKYREDNPVIGVKRLKIEGDGATPWPEDGYAFVLKHAPVDLYRAAYLGRATGQRAGDLVRMKAADLEPDGIRVSIGKRRETPHFVPLTKEQMTEILSWGVEPMDRFIKSTRGRAYTATHLNSRWNRWRASVEAKPIEGMKMTLHGLRAHKIFDLSSHGLSDRAISDEVGISPQMVNRYLRFADKATAARRSRDRREKEAS
jgi:integrase